MEKKVNGNGLFRTPFSKDYWKAALGEFRDLKMLLFAALMIAVRVLLKGLKIPIAPSIEINTAFVANAFGAMIYGPLVALAGAVVSDTLGCILFPSGPYFFPFVFTEMASSLVFALFLYRTEVSTTRLTLARFCICLFVNILMSEPIFIWYYNWLHNPYTPFQILRIVKNLVMFPIESVVLTILFRYLIPPFKKQGYVQTGVSRLKFTKKHIAVLVSLVVIGTGATLGYLAWFYNTKTISSTYTAEDRQTKNLAMNEWINETYPDQDHEDQVTVIESATSKLFDPEVRYVLAVYRIDKAKFGEQALSNPEYSLETIYQYSKSPARKDEALIRIGEGNAVTGKFDNKQISTEINWLDTTEKENPET
ncbi:MAG: folate family ECF transporter S component [Clostridia bacterium]|nr:folate family ECF transporter S component [Clostridia bacterium]